jgi:hypothetical protein
MKKPTFAELYAFELNIETAAAAVLTTGGFTVISPFVQLDASGQPVDLKSVPENHCTVEFSAGDTDATSKVGYTDANGVLTGDADEFGWEGELAIVHRVGMDDLPPKPGEPLGCYAKLCRQRGMIRALLLGPHRPFKDSLNWYSILSIRLVQPERRVDQPRQANEATERFRIRFLPARGAI